MPLKALSLSAVALATAAVTTTGCATSKRAAVDTAPPAVAAPVPAAPAPAAAEVATGPARDALISLQKVHFAYDSYDLLPSARAALDEAASKLVAMDDVHVLLTGHTDARGSDGYNAWLGLARARAAADYLASKGIPAERLDIRSYGEVRPKADGQDTVAHAKNRRVEFRLVRGDVQLVLNDGVIVDDQGRVISSEDQVARR